MADEIPYQQANQVRQLLGMRKNAVAYGQTTQIEAADKQLEGLGYKTERQAAKATEAAEARAKAAAETSEGEPEKIPPQGRSSRPRQTTKENT